MAAPLGLLAALLFAQSLDPARGPGSGTGPGTSTAPPVGTSGTPTAVDLEEPVVPRAEPVRYSIGLRAELHSGHPYGSGPAVTDGELDPLAALLVPFGGGGLTLAYEPRIFFTASAAPQHFQTLHRGRLMVETDIGPRWHLSMAVRAGYGEYDFLPLSTVIPGNTGTGQGGTSGQTTSTPTPAPQIPGTSSLPDQRFLHVVDLNATAGVAHVFTPRLFWLLSGGYLLSGGADVTAQQSLPLQKAPLASTGPRWVLDPSDSLTLLLSGMDSRFSSGPRATIINLTGTWSHAWARNWQTDLIGGAGAFHGTVPGRPANDSVLPVGGFTVTQTFLRPLGNIRNSLQFLASPLPDSINGAIYERLTANLISSIPLQGWLFLDLTGGASMSIGISQRDARGEARLTFLIAPQVSVAVGARVAYLEGSNLLGPSGVGWLGFLLLTAYVPNGPL